MHYQDIRDWCHPRICPYRPDEGVDSRRFVLANIGKVIDGDWDLQRMDFEENEVYRLLHQRFALGMEWREIELFQRYAREIAAGKRRWRNSSSYEELLATSVEVENLYQEIRDNSYRTAGGQGLSADEVTVSIGRNGELLYNNVGGHHRLSIVKLLGLRSVPVAVLLRHSDWQALRDRVRRASSADELDSQARRFLGHPDLAELVAALIH